MLCLKAEGSNQKVRDMEQGLVRVLPQTNQSPAQRRSLTHLGTYAERGKPVLLPPGTASRKASPWKCGYGIAEEANAGL